MLRNVIQSIEPVEPKQIPENLAERRRALRVRCYCQAQAIVEGESHKATVTDLGLEGVRIKSMSAPFKQGAEVAVAYRPPHSDGGAECGVVRCNVLWVQRSGREMVAGLRYNDSRENMRSSWVRYVLTELGFDESRTFQRRQHLRVDAAMPARVFHNGEVALTDAKVVNLGIGGALVESKDELPTGSRIEMEISLWRILPTLALNGVVLHTRREPGCDGVLHSVQFGALDPGDVKLLGNYIINLINQTSL